VYAGGVVVLIIFGIMLTQRTKTSGLKVLQNYTTAGLLMGAGFLFVLINLFQRKPTADSFASAAPVQNIGVALMTDYSLPLEVSGILLLVCLIASAFAATAHQRK
jgi:NADH-quinone oxidoreductase subunit J